MDPIKSMSRFAGVRLVVLMGISFFIGLQFRSLRVLFRSSHYDRPERGHLAWAPENMHRKHSGENKRRVQNARVKKVKETIKQDKESDGKEDAKQGKKPKKERPLQRFNAMNYTNEFEPLPWTLPKPSELFDLSSAEFMEKYIASKRNTKFSLPWEQALDDYGSTKLPLPVISLNFPKSATLTMRQYFKCGGVTSIHTSTQQGRIGICMMENLLADNPPMQSCDTHKRQGDPKKIGFISDIGLQGPPCFYSSLHDGGLEAIAKHYPTSTMLLVTRNSTSWYNSIKKWGTLLNRWKTVCKFDGSYHSEQVQFWNDMYDSESPEVYWSNFYNAHTQKIREFAMNHPSLTYVEVQLEDPKMGELLEYYTGIPSTCVMDCHPGPHWYKRTNATSKCHPPGELDATNAPKGAANVHGDDDDDDQNDNNEEENNQES
jgi:hypothetical protein